MAKVLYSSRLITRNDVCIVELYDDSSPGVDGRRIRIDVTDSKNQLDEEESRVVQMSRTWLATQQHSEIEILRLLIQFRKKLPKTISSASKALFQYPEWDKDSKVYQVGRLILTFFGALPMETLSPEYIRNSIQIEPAEITALLEEFRANKFLFKAGPGSTEYRVAHDWSRRLRELLDSLKPLSWEDGGGVTVVPEPAELKLTVSDPVVTVGQAFCQVEMHTGESCSRPIIANEKCVCHLEGDKDLDAFREEVRKVIDNSDIHDFTGFIFPEHYQFPARRHFMGKLILKECAFECFVALRESVFESAVLMDNCSLNKGASFVFARFRSEFEMRYCDASFLDFGGAVFERGFVFVQNTRTSSDVDLSDRFLNGVPFDFAGAVFEDGARVFIKSISPSNIGLRGTNLARAEHIHFLGLSRKKNDTYKLADENAQAIKGVIDPSILSDYYSRVCDAYQQLQRHYNSLRNYTDAGGFHEREMEIRRRFLSVSLPNRLLHEVYRFLAGYGESIRRPVLLLAALLLIFPVISMLFMGDAPYHLTFQLADTPEAVFGYVQDFAANLESLFYSKTNPFAYKYSHPQATPGGIWRVVLIVERVLAVLILSFIIVSARRRFRRY